MRAASRTKPAEVVEMRDFVDAGQKGADLWAPFRYAMEYWKAVYKENHRAQQLEGALKSSTKAKASEANKGKPRKNTGLKRRNMLRPFIAEVGRGRCKYSGFKHPLAHHYASRIYIKARLVLYGHVSRMRLKDDLSWSEVASRIGVEKVDVGNFVQKLNINLITFCKAARYFGIDPISAMELGRLDDFPGFFEMLERYGKTVYLKDAKAWIRETWPEAVHVLRDE